GSHEHLVQLVGVFVSFFQAEDGIRVRNVTGVQTCALPISRGVPPRSGSIVSSACASTVSVYSIEAVRPSSSSTFTVKVCSPSARSEERRVGKERVSG